MEGIERNPCDSPSANESLRLSEERFRLLVEGVKDYALFMLDPAGRIVSWNEGAERLKGYKETEIIGRHFSCFYPAEAIRAGHPDTELLLAGSNGRYAEEGWRVLMEVQGGDKYRHEGMQRLLQEEMMKLGVRLGVSEMLYRGSLPNYHALIDINQSKEGVLGGAHAGIGNRDHEYTLVLLLTVEAGHRHDLRIEELPQEAGSRGVVLIARTHVEDLRSLVPMRG